MHIWCMYSLAHNICLPFWAVPSEISFERLPEKIIQKYFGETECHMHVIEFEPFLKHLFISSI